MLYIYLFTCCREIISALQLVFGHMQSSSEGVYDLAPLATLLELNTGEQQDPSEFNALFMQLLERCLKGGMHNNNGKMYVYSVPVCRHVL